MPQEIEIDAACLTSFRDHTCPASAKMHVEIEVRSKMNEIGNILAHNRQQYLAIRTSWLEIIIFCLIREMFQFNYSTDTL